MTTISRRQIIKISFAAPVLTGSVAACDYTLVIAIVSVVIRAIASVVGEKANSTAPQERSAELLEVAQGTVRLANKSGTNQFVEIEVELIHNEEGLQNKITVERELERKSTVELTLPNMGTKTAGLHFIRVTVDGSSLDSELEYLDWVNAP